MTQPDKIQSMMIDQSINQLINHSTFTSANQPVVQSVDRPIS